jgi:hypothetical protein
VPPWHDGTWLLIGATVEDTGFTHTRKYSKTGIAQLP